MFFNNIPRIPMPKADFNKYVEERISEWTRTHSQLARQLAFYYEKDGVCYPRFGVRATIDELFAYMTFWAEHYFIPNPYSPSLKQFEPKCIYSFLIERVGEGDISFDATLDGIFNIPLSSHDKVKCFLNNFTPLQISEDQMSLKYDNARKVESDIPITCKEDYAAYFHFFDKEIDQRSGLLVNKALGPLQKIVYGAPGTGKSHQTFEKTKGHEVIRTTFHPDSDYSTFVGAYKPQMEKGTSTGIQPNLDYDALVEKLKEYIALRPDVSKACTLFGFDYHDSLVSMKNSGKSIRNLVDEAYKPGSAHTDYVRVGMFLKESTPAPNRDEKKIVYKFTQQAFLKAYINAWKLYSQAEEGEAPKPQFLIIEEINRGNCAQIFGDIFQLLDRNDEGFSTYPITLDTDIMQELNEALSGLSINNRDAINALYGEDVMATVLDGSKMLLPPNLYIWATMNTSDQSLFPIDSAFKRRWEWEYVKIVKGCDEDGNELDWKINVDGEVTDWWEFLQAINDRIGSETNSDDKKLGYFFCKAKSGVIDVKTFVGKVVFYLWNDVFKDGDQSIFKVDDTKDPAFEQFYNDDRDCTPNADAVKRFIKNVMGEKTDEETPAVDAE